jgi:PDZ domain-containing protein
MKTVLVRHKIEFLIGLFFLVGSLLVSFIYVPYTITAPGYNNEVGDFITISDPYPVEGTFRTTSVIALNRVTLIQKWIGTIEDTVTVNERPEYFNNINVSDLKVTGTLSKNDSLHNSLVVGISRTNETIDYDAFYMVYLTYNILDPDTIEIGDIIQTVNGSSDVINELANVGCDETAVVAILREDTEYTYTITRHQLDDGTCQFGLYVRSFTEIYDSTVDYVLDNNYTRGSSGGLMQSLYIFNLLTPNDLTGGLDIAGTGTIDVDGNVGRIGGIEQKIITSALNGMDIFFVPYLSDSDSDNYIVAQQVLETLETDMILVPVQTFDDAISYLERQFGGAYDE